MKTVNYSFFRNNLKSVCDDVTDNDEIVLLCRKEGKNVVVLSLEKYNEYLEVLERAAVKVC